MESTRSGLQWSVAEGQARSATRAVLVAQLEGLLLDEVTIPPGPLDRLRETVAAHEGTVVRQGTTSLCATFPSAQGALEAAMVTQQGCRPGEARNAGEPGAGGWRIGVDASRSATSLRGDPTLVPLIGAKHLADEAATGEVLASDRVWELLGSRASLVFHRSRRIEVPGVPDRLSAWSVSCEPVALSAASRLPSVLWSQSEEPFVGRVSEAATLRNAWRRAKAGGSRLLFVSGPPGVGKTRLAAQLGGLVVDDGGVVLYGGRDETAGVPYQIFVESLLQLADQEFVVPLGTSQRGELARLSPELVSEPVAGSELPADADAGRYRLFEAVTAFLAGAAEHRPLLIVLDDLQWMHREESLLLGHLMRHLGSARILVVGLHRDDLPDVDPIGLATAGLDGDAVERLDLAGLAESDVLDFLTAFAPGVDWRRSRRAGDLWRTTQGNPFFMALAARELVESGVGGAVDPAGSPDGADLAGGMAELVLRRVQRLPESTRRTLEQAATLGRHFDAAFLARAIGGLDEVAVETALEQARSLGLLRSVRGSYTFAHVVVRQVLLANLERSERQELHRRAAEAFEAADDERSCEVSAIATCYRLAGESVPAGTTIEWSIRAGEAAVASFAWEEARGHWEAALELMESGGGVPAQRALLRRRIADLAVVTGSDLPRGIEHAEKALALYEELGEDDLAAKMHARLGRDLSVFPETMDVGRALRHLGAAHSILARTPEPPLLGYVHSGRAGALLWANDPAQGLEAAQRGLDIARREGRRALEAQATMLVGWHESAMGELADGLRQIERAWQLADRLDHRYVGCLCAWARGLWGLLLLEPGVSARWFERELARPRMAEIPSQIQVLGGQLAWARALRGDLVGARGAMALAPEGNVGFVYSPPLSLFEGDWKQAVERLTAGRLRAQDSGNRLEEWGVTRWLGEAFLLLDESVEAEAVLDQAVRLASASGHVAAEAATRCGLVLACARRGDTPAAAAHLSRLDELVTADESWAGLAGVYAHASAVLAAQEGRLDGAWADFGRAVAVLRRHNLVWHEADALLSWAAALGAAGEAGRARECRRSARQVYRRIGAGPRWIGRTQVDERGRRSSRSSG